MLAENHIEGRKKTLIPRCEQTKPCFRCTSHGIECTVAKNSPKKIKTPRRRKIKKIKNEVEEEEDEDFEEFSPIEYLDLDSQEVMYFAAEILTSFKSLEKR